MQSAIKTLLLLCFYDCYFDKVITTTTEFNDKNDLLTKNVICKKLKIQFFNFSSDTRLVAQRFLWTFALYRSGHLLHTVISTALHLLCDAQDSPFFTSNLIAETQ